MTNLNSFYVDEPDLYFAEKNRFRDPKGGLYLYGPYGKYEKEPYFMTINAGIIGTSKSIGRVIDFFDLCKNKIPAKSKGGIDFPGVGLDKKLQFEIKFPDHLQEPITNSELLEGEKIDTRSERARYFLDLIDTRLDIITQREPFPDLVYVPLSRELIDLCKKPGQIGDKIRIAQRRFTDNLTEDQLIGDYDFHDIIKVFGMKYKIPTQVILPNSLSLKQNPNVQFLAQRAWNLSVASYYKAKGIPWKLAELDNDACYVGITFYRELNKEKNQVMRASVAQLFLATGESIVLRGKPFEWSEDRKQPELSFEQAIDLSTKIIDTYEKTHKRKPKRMVVHKSSPFNREEINGFLSAYDTVNEIDLLSIRSSPIDWYRDGLYAIPRGTVIKSPDDKFYIFTLGYIPQLDTFPKPGTPIPIEVTPVNLDTSERKMCKEILSLTKLNWNNADFCDQKPITIVASESVKEILSEARVRDIEIISQYRYYI
ncbi:MAG: argonaute/piwi family protein [Candidatus Hodarchaeales archaeon]